MNKQKKSCLEMIFKALETLPPLPRELKKLSKMGRGEMIFTCPVHDWFELTYAQYLTIPRSLLQEMPHEWQERFVKCLDEFDEHFDGWRPPEGRYWCRLKDGRGRFVDDPFSNYRHSCWTPEKVKQLRGETT